MGRTPCCDKTGLKKGAWTSEEDQKLIAYIRRYGIWNWRELPKYAGLSRCGKSCRLRWVNYLRPNVKRGNYTREEEEIINKLHESLGNRWSAIAAKLPGRTDNEIKNYWHTNLKKGSKQISKASEAKLESHEIPQSEEEKKNDVREPKTYQILVSSPVMSLKPSSFSEFSSLNLEPAAERNTNNVEDNTAASETIAEPRGNFWTEPYLAGNSYIEEDFPATFLDPISLFAFDESFSPCGAYSNDAIEWFNQLALSDT